MSEADDEEDFAETRDATAKDEERHGVLSFELHSGGGGRRSCELLVGVAGVFERQLPDMASEYITRIAFDPRHRSLVMLHGGSVIGGVCFRSFPEPRFSLVEVVFVAVTGSKRVRGYGTHLISHLKDVMRAEGLRTALTFADNTARMFFQKQGFTRRITFPLERYAGLIKYYHGAILMQLDVHPAVPRYVDVPGSLIAPQRAALQRLIMDCGADADPAAVALELASLSQSSSPSLSQQQSASSVVWKVEDPPLKRELRDLLGRIRRHPCSWPFRHAVDVDAVPGYLDVITEPVDLTLIASRLESGRYDTNRGAFVHDIRLMIENARTFNPPGNQYHQLADELLAAFQDELSLSM